MEERIVRVRRFDPVLLYLLVQVLKQNMSAIRSLYVSSRLPFPQVDAFISECVKK